MSVETLNFFAALGTIALQLATLLLLATIVLDRRIPDIGDISGAISRHGLWVALVFSAFASVMTLVYSEILAFEPCGLCWVQRVFLYPLVVLFALALWKKERIIADYVIALSGAGLLVALYQHYLQMGGTDILPCPAAPTAADCAQRILFEFGYITFPLMAVSLFAFLIVLMLFVRR